MGGCATKPRELKAEEEAPLPLAEPPTATDTKAGGAREETEESRQGGEKTEKKTAEESAEEKEEHAQPDENRRRSLGSLLKDNEDVKVSSEEDNVVVKETITSSTIEAKSALQQPKTGEHSAEASVAKTVELEISNTTQEEASIASDLATSQAIFKDNKQVDLNTKERDISVVKEVVDLSTESDSEI